MCVIALKSFVAQYFLMRPVYGVIVCSPDAILHYHVLTHIRPVSSVHLRDKLTVYNLSKDITAVVFSMF